MPPPLGGGGGGGASSQSGVSFRLQHLLCPTSLLGGTGSCSIENAPPGKPHPSPRAGMAAGRTPHRCPSPLGGPRCRHPEDVGQESRPASLHSPSCPPSGAAGEHGAIVGARLVPPQAHRAHHMPCWLPPPPHAWALTWWLVFPLFPLTSVVSPSWSQIWSRKQNKVQLSLRQGLAPWRQHPPTSLLQSAWGPDLPDLSRILQPALIARNIALLLPFQSLN